jgi:hypothetical protein
MKPMIAVLLCIFVAIAPQAWAAPGAHGPNGEHLDGPATGAANASQAPRFEANTETFEMVGRLQGGELTMMVNRFESNEPVLQATVEVAFGKLKAKAQFHADMGDFSVDDAAMLKALQVPGDHALVITIRAGKDTDLLDAVLKVAAPAAAHGHGHDHTDWRHLAADIAIGLGGLAAVGGAVMFYVRKRRARMAVQMVGGTK